MELSDQDGYFFGNSSRNCLAASHITCNFPNADSRDRYFMPQSDANITRSSFTNDKARRTRVTTIRPVLLFHQADMVRVKRIIDNGFPGAVRLPFDDVTIIGRQENLLAIL